MRGKYSPNLPIDHQTREYIYNCYGQPCSPYDGDQSKWDEKTMFGDYDHEGFDRYGYSSFDSDGNYTFGSGVDRNGYTEMDYLSMSQEEFDWI